MVPDAANAYRSARDRIERQLRQIRDLLHMHANKAMAHPGDFSFVGDLTHVSETLNEVVTTLGGRPDEPTEAAQR